MTNIQTSIQNMKTDFKALRAQGYWFAAKRFGWGWTPIAWQGWLAILIYICLLLRDVLDTVAYDTTISHSGSDTLLYFAPSFLLYTTLLMLLCYGKGQKPHWNWSSKFDEEKSNISNT